MDMLYFQLVQENTILNLKSTNNPILEGTLSLTCACASRKSKTDN